MLPVKLTAWLDIESLLPPLASDRFQALKDSIAANGLLVPLVCLPDGRLIDGHHRWRACQEKGVTPRVEVHDIGEAEALDLALTLNVARRQLSPEQRKELGLSLRKRGWRQQRVASALGVAQQTVDAWEGKGSDTKNGNASPPDLRMRVSPSQQKMIGQRAAAATCGLALASQKTRSPSTEGQFVARDGRGLPTGTLTPVRLT